MLVSAGKLDFQSLGKSLGNSASGRLRDPQSAAHVFSEARTGGTDPPDPKTLYTRSGHLPKVSKSGI